LVKIEDLGFGDDAAILTRVEAYKLSWQMFIEKPLTGYGFGSFNGYNNIEWTTIQKYPHNIILEILSELGIFGLSLFLLLCYSIIKKILNPQSPINNHQPVPMGSTIIILLVFSLWLAMFSKDISTQSFLWLFLVAYSIPNQASRI